MIALALQLEYFNTADESMTSSVRASTVVTAATGTLSSAVIGCRVAAASNNLPEAHHDEPWPRATHWVTRGLPMGRPSIGPRSFQS